MGFLTDLFDDVVDIASAPIKLGSRIIDNIADSELEDCVDDLKDAVKIKK